MRLADAVRGVRRRLGVDRPHDRYLLEEVIFPALLDRADVRRVLFVGCDSYTAHYPALFADREFTTIDSDPAKSRYAADRHIVGSLVDLGAHFKPASLDAVICNGVFGWGLDSPEEIDAAASACFDCLRPGGIMIVGWNDLEPWRPPALDSVPALARFERLTLAPFPAPDYPTLGRLRHVFSFYARPG